MDFNTCCAYCCTGLSLFGVVGLVSFGLVLQAGGNWYLGVSEENAKGAAQGCFVGAGIYAAYIVLCGYRVCKLARKKPDREREEGLLERYD
ncbi:hypothetical protein AB1Y20_013769 [Prymnesium parvum]|uniref:Uncharacterized protein n=1 Tax=Prymnesium parvum TaxID=97485 RepID=A0AB34IDW3_PRYPA